MIGSEPWVVGCCPRKQSVVVATSVFQVSQVPKHIDKNTSITDDEFAFVFTTAGTAAADDRDGMTDLAPPPVVEVVSRFAWVASDASEVSRRAAVATTSAGWAELLRDVRFRLANTWLSCEQASILASTFPARVKGIAGSPREDLVVGLFGRVTDVDLFCDVLDTLDKAGQLSVGRRLGWLNALNPHHADRHYDLDLRLSDHRRLARVLAEMAVVEPGANLQNQRFSRHADAARHSFIPGWEMPLTWSAPTSGPHGGAQAGVPDDGHYTMEYSSDEAMGCRADPETRERLRGEYFLCGVSRDRGLGAFGFVDEELARKLAEQPSL